MFLVQAFVVFLITICNDPSVEPRSWLLFWSTLFWLDSTYISLLSSCCIWHFTAHRHEEIELLFCFHHNVTKWIIFREEVRNNLVCHISVSFNHFFLFLFFNIHSFSRHHYRHHDTWNINKVSVLYKLRKLPYPRASSSLFWVISDLLIRVDIVKHNYKEMKFS